MLEALEVYKVSVESYVIPLLPSHILEQIDGDTMDDWVHLQWAFSVLVRSQN